MKDEATQNIQSLSNTVNSTDQLTMYTLLEKNSRITSREQSKMTIASIFHFSKLISLKKNPHPASQ
jgi:hypothetical protein